VFLLLLDGAADWLAPLTIRNGEEVCVAALRVAKVIDPAYWVVAAEDMPLVGFYEHQSRALVVAVLVEALRNVEC